MSLELQMWLEQVALWRLQRAHVEPKQEKQEQSEREEPSEVAYPTGYPPVLAAS